MSLIPPGYPAPQRSLATDALVPAITNVQGTAEQAQVFFQAAATPGGRLVMETEKNRSYANGLALGVLIGAIAVYGALGHFMSRR